MFRYSHPGSHPVLGVLLAVFLGVLVVVAIVALVRYWHTVPRHASGGAVGPTGQPPSVPPVDPALTELRVRYARGEITWEEFAQRAAHLGYPFPPPSAPGP